MSDWISVENSLPEDWQHVLVCDANKESDEYGVEPDVYFATFTPCGKGCCESKFEVQGNFWISSDSVTHWMELPKPFEEFLNEQ